jgi:hypothetical protein
MKTTLSFAAHIAIYILWIAVAVVIRQAGRAILGKQVEMILGVVVISGFFGGLAWLWLRAKREKTAGKKSQE